MNTFDIVPFFLVGGGAIFLAVMELRDSLKDDRERLTDLLWKMLEGQVGQRAVTQPIATTPFAYGLLGMIAGIGVYSILFPLWMAAAFYAGYIVFLLCILLGATWQLRMIRMFMRTHHQHVARVVGR